MALAPSKRLCFKQPGSYLGWSLCAESSGGLDRGAVLVPKQAMVGLWAEYPRHDSHVRFPLEGGWPRLLADGGPGSPACANGARRGVWLLLAEEVGGEVVLALEEEVAG